MFILTWICIGMLPCQSIRFYDEFKKYTSHRWHTFTGSFSHISVLNRKEPDLSKCSFEAKILRKNSHVYINLDLYRNASMSIYKIL